MYFRRLTDKLRACLLFKCPFFSNQSSILAVLVVLFTNFEFNISVFSVFNCFGGFLVPVFLNKSTSDLSALFLCLSVSMLIKYSRTDSALAGQ